jgi:hypothetical protein
MSTEADDQVPATPLKVPPASDLETLTAALRRWAGSENRRIAAVELLAWHDYWLRRPDFRNACVREIPHSGTAVISWENVRQYADSQPGCSTSQMTVLRLAIAIGTDDLGLSGFGAAHRSAAARAFATAMGLAFDETAFTPPQAKPWIDELEAGRG